MPVGRVLKYSDLQKIGIDSVIVQKLSSILRIADGLDRTHASAVKDVKCLSSNGELTMILEKANQNGDNQLELEIWGAESKKALFEETYGVKVKFEVNGSNS